jgi:hypothetical protein
MPVTASERWPDWLTALDVRLEGPHLKYHADRELGLRLLKAGFGAIFDRKLRGAHLYSRSFEEFCLRRGRTVWSSATAPPGRMTGP